MNLCSFLFESGQKRNDDVENIGTTFFDAKNKIVTTNGIKPKIEVLVYFYKCHSLAF